jgi:hypothetical protein
MKKTLVLATAMAMISATAYANGGDSPVRHEEEPGVVVVMPIAESSSYAVAVSDQEQAQAQEQAQDQTQSQTMNGSNNSKLEVNQNYEAVRNHMNAPAVLNSDAQLTSNRETNAKNRGVFFGKIPYVTLYSAQKAAKTAKDVDVSPALLMENDFQTLTLNMQNITGESMGYIYLTANGGKINRAALEARAMVEAMKAGATGARMVFTDSATWSQGGAWNVGLSGGASLMRNGDKTDIAPSIGFGAGGAHAFSEALPNVVIECFFDASLLLKNKDGSIKFAKSVTANTEHH